MNYDINYTNNPIMSEIRVKLPADFLVALGEITRDYHTSASMVIGSLVAAILTGDITPVRSFRNRPIVALNLTETPSDIFIKFRDKDGKIINDSPFSDELVDMYWGVNRTIGAPSTKTNMFMQPVSSDFYMDDDYNEANYE